MPKKGEPRVTVRLPEAAKQKLVRIARKVAPKGTRGNASMAIRNLIDKEKI